MEIGNETEDWNSYPDSVCCPLLRSKTLRVSFKRRDGGIQVVGVRVVTDPVYLS